ncbi:ribonuclease [Mycobacterium tuberculosis variant bovis BCG]|nr:ribonuclease [Mycobacterium tuberculosis variant bovis BCG]
MPNTNSRVVTSPKPGQSNWASMPYLAAARKSHPTLLGAPLAPEVAVENIEQFTSRPHVRQVGEANGFWPVYRRVADPVKPRGNLVPDAHLVALMRHHGIATIWSHDRDFRKFEGIRIRDPFSG